MAHSIVGNEATFQCNSPEKLNRIFHFFKSANVFFICLKSVYISITQFHRENESLWK